MSNAAKKAAMRDITQWLHDEGKTLISVSRRQMAGAREVCEGDLYASVDGWYLNRTRLSYRY